MKVDRTRALLPLVLSGLLWGCFDQVAGNSTETENNATARSIRVDSILPDWNRPWWTSTVATLRLDRSNFDFSTTDSTGRDLLLRVSPEVPVPFEIVFWDKKAGLGRLHVRIDPLLEAPGARFQLLWNQALKSRDDSVAVWAGITDSQRLAINSVLVDDFENGIPVDQLPNGAAWNTNHSDSATITAFGIVPDPLRIRGRVLHMAYEAGVGRPWWVVATTALATTPRCLRSVDSLVMWVRGAGTLDAFSVALEHVGPAGSFKAWKKVVLDTAWTRVRLRPSDFDTADANAQSVGWSGVRDSVTNFTFLDGGQGEFWVDDIRIYGIGPDDLR
jgi:hypothetical protein